MTEKINVTYKNLKVGQEINGIIYEGRHSLFSAIIKEINPISVTYLMWGKSEEKISSDAMFIINMPEEDFENKYREKAKEILISIQNTLRKDEIGEHEMWNAWLFGTPFEMAQSCIKENFTIIGHCNDIYPKRSMFSDEVYDIGVCAETKDGEKFWCHYRSQDLSDMLERYKNLLD